MGQNHHGLNWQVNQTRFGLVSKTKRSERDRVRYLNLPPKFRVILIMNNWIDSEWFKKWLELARHEQ